MNEVYHTNQTSLRCRGKGVSCRKRALCPKKIKCIKKNDKAGLQVRKHKKRAFISQKERKERLKNVEKILSLHTNQCYLHNLFH